MEETLKKSGENNEKVSTEILVWRTSNKYHKFILREMSGKIY